MIITLQMFKTAGVHLGFIIKYLELIPYEPE